MNFIAVDIGSTYIKAALYDLTFDKVIYTRKFCTPEKITTGDPWAYEVDAGEIARQIKNIIEKCSQITDEISGILFSTQQHGCVLHHPDMERDIYISWQDQRCLKIDPKTGKRYFEEIKELLTPEDMEKTGLPIKPMMALCNLYTLFTEKKEQMKKDGYTLYTLGSYVIEQLCGRNICHITNAAPLGFVDLHTGTWDYSILQKVGLDFFRLPEICSDLACCGTYSCKGREIPIYPDLGDVQTSVYSTGAVTGDLIANVGTAGQLIMIRDDFTPGDYEIRPYYDNNYCYVISRMPGGRNFDVQIEFIRSIGERIFGINLDRSEIWNHLQKYCENADTGNLEVDCSFYELPDRLADGKILHINNVNFTPENVFMATAKDFGRQYRRFAKKLCRLEDFTGTFYFTGGTVARNSYLKNAIQKEMGIENAVGLAQDEVYGGLFKLAKRCVVPGEAPERSERQGIKINLQARKEDIK